MPRPYHSPSSVALGERCERAWFCAYVLGLRSPGSRATELGGEVHQIYEAWYRGLTGRQAPNWASRAGQIAQSAIHLLPAPGTVDAYPEEAIGGPWCGESRVLLRPDGDVTPFAPNGCRDSSKPGRALLVDGQRYAGFRDLVVEYEFAEGARLIGAELAVEHGIILIDYKTSRDIHKYGKPPAVLVDDFAANLYAIDVGLAFDREVIPCRWPYISTGTKREALPSDFVIHVDRAYEVVAARTPTVKRLDSLERIEDAECNTEACADYGGCPYHESKGGPCTARRSISAQILALSKGPDQMAISDEARAKFAAFKSQRQAPAAPPTEEPAESIDTAKTEPPPPPVVAKATPAVKAPPAAKAKSVPATKAAPPEPEPEVEAPATDEASLDDEVIVGIAERITAAYTRIAEIKARAIGLDEAEAELALAIQDMRDAVR